ncbi:MAG: ATP synthase subunit I [Betaproteobacteria bacterium]|nr:ATP synthase subunit I [Betaproteobacteria bacterium]
MLSPRLKPFRAVLRWQAFATALLTGVAGYLVGTNGAISAALGGLVGMIGGLGFAVVASLQKGGTAGSVLITAMRAEAVKIVVMIALLWLVLATYRDVVVVGFIGTFVVTVLVFTMAVFVREE